MGSGFPQPVGVGTVTAINGVLPDGGGNVAIGATNIPYTPTFATAGTTGNPSATVGAQLLWSETHLGTASVVWGEATLEDAFPVAANVHTIDRPSIWTVPLGGAPVVLTAGNSIESTHPGSALALGSVKVAVIGNVAGPLVFGEQALEGFTLLNTNGDPAAVDLQAESLAGRFVVLSDVTLLGQGGAVIEDIFGVLSWRGAGLAPAAPGASGISIDGTNSTVILVNAVAQAPAGGGYVGINLEPTASIANQLVVTSSTLIGQDATDALVRIDPAASVPRSPLPSAVVGVRIADTTITGTAGQLFESTGLGADAIEVSSFGHLNGPRSNWIGDARLDTAGAPPDALLDHTGNAGLPLPVPGDNAQAGGAGATFRELAVTAATTRHSLLLGLVASTSVNAGGTYTGGDGDYPATQASTSGTGSGAEFTVTLTGGSITAVVSVDEVGTDYAITDTITLTVVGPTETVAAVLDVNNITWLLRTDGPVDNLTGPVGWFVDHQRDAAAGSTVFGYLERRKGGLGAWSEVPNTRSLPQALTNIPTRAGASTVIDDLGVADEWRIAWINNDVGSSGTRFTIVEITVEGQP